MERLNDQKEKVMVGKTKEESTALQNEDCQLSDEQLDTVVGGFMPYSNHNNNNDGSGNVFPNR